MLKHGYTWYYAQPNLYSLKKKLGGKLWGKPSNTWFDRNCWEAQQNFYMVFNSSHLNKTSIMAFKKYHMMIQYKKCSYLECKQKEPHLLLKSNSRIFWKSFEEKYDLTTSPPPIYATINSIILHKTNFLMFLQ